MNDYKPVKFKHKRKMSRATVRTIVFRIIPLILVVIIAVCGFTLFDKKISELIASQKYSELADRGIIDDPNDDTFASSDVTWENSYTTTDPNGFDPLSLSPLGLTNGLRPSASLGLTDFERALGYTNKQSKLWSIHDTVNSDICAWVYMYGMGINYPVAEDASNTDFYLTHSYDKTKATSGTIFMSESCTINPISRNLILHGHNMRDGTMFATLNNYLIGNTSFYNAHKYIFIDTLYGTYRYEIYSVYKTNPEDIYLQTAFGSNAAFLNWCNETNNKGLFKSDTTTFSATDRILTLSTCDATAKFRIVVHAKMIYPVPTTDIDSGNTVVDNNDEPQIVIDPEDVTPTPNNSEIVTPAPEFSEGSQYRVKLTDTKSTLRLRSGPGTNYNIEASLSHGTKVTIISQDGEWVKVKTEGGMEGYLQKAKLVPESEFSYQIPGGEITAPSANIITPSPAPTPIPN